MTSHEHHPLDVLDPRFPITITDTPGTYESHFWDLRNLRPDRPCIDGLVLRARADAAIRRETYVRSLPGPRFIPAITHDDTAGDILPRGWWRDTFAREGMPQPEDTDTFLVACDQADQDEQERRTVRRALSRAISALRHQPPAGAL